jgi:hypothetical protein
MLLSIAIASAFAGTTDLSAEMDRAARPAEGPHVDVIAQTVAPLSVGGRLQAELPGRFRIAGHGGVMPKAYVAALSGLAVAVGAYDAEIGTTVQDSIAPALVVGGSIGVRPAKNAGFVMDVGWQYMDVHTSVDTAVVAGSMLGVDAAAQAPGAIDGHTAIHMVTADLGYEHSFKGFFFRAALGGAFTVSSKTQIAAPESNTYAAARAVMDSSAQVVDKVLEGAGFLPTLSIGMGARFR